MNDEGTPVPFSLIDRNMMTNPRMANSFSSKTSIHGLVVAVQSPVGRFKGEP